MGLEEDIVQSCVKHMNDCAKRIEQLKSLKVNEDYEAQLRPLITKEIEKCVNEYLKTLTFLTQKIEEIQQAPLRPEKESKDTTNIEELPYKLLVKLLQSNGLIDEEGNLTEKGAKLLEEELKKKEYTQATGAAKGEDYQIESVERKNGLEFIKSLGLFKEPEKEEVWLSEIIDETKPFDMFPKLGPEERKENEISSLEEEIRYLIERRAKIKPKTEEDLVICPNCLSKVELKDTCSVCDYRLIKEKKPVEEKLEEPVPVEEEVPPEEPPLETTVESRVKEEPVLQEKEIPQEVHVEPALGEKYLAGLFVNFVSYFSISVGVVILSGCIFIILLGIRGLEEAKLDLAELLYFIVDSLPGVPFSSRILSPLSFSLSIGSIALFGVIMILLGFGFRRDLRLSKLSGVIIFVLSSLIDVYSILIIDFSEVIIPFLSLVINIVIVYMILNWLKWSGAES